MDWVEPSRIELRKIRFVGYSGLREAISMKKRYSTSDITILSNASSAFCIGMLTASAVMLC